MHTPGPWQFRETKGAGIEIWAPVNLGPSIESSTGELIGPVLQPVYEAFIKPRLTVEADGRVYCQISYESWRQFPTIKFDEMQRANGHLIACAPDLLDALETAVNELETIAADSRSVIDYCRKILEKATYIKHDQ